MDVGSELLNGRRAGMLTIGLRPASSLPLLVETRDDLVVRGPVCEGHADLLGSSALDFLVALHRRFDRRRRELLHRRALVQREIDYELQPRFPPDSTAVRREEWTAAPIASDLADRRVEIVLPPNRATIVAALTSGAQTYVADFDTATSPRWAHLLEGQALLRDATRGSLPGTNGRPIERPARSATLVVTPRGWHLNEPHVCVDEQAMSAALFDFGLYLFHNGEALVQQGSGPYFYLTKLQSRLEARLWADVFAFAERYLGLPPGSIRATIRVDHILAALEMDELLWELREYAAGLSCARWAYAASLIATFRRRPFALPDRDQLTTDQPFYRAYADLLVHTAHRRGVHALAGVSTRRPVTSHSAARRLWVKQVRLDAMREVTAGFDGTGVTHAALVPVVSEIFDAYMPGPHQIEWRRDDTAGFEDELLTVPRGSVSETGLRRSARATLAYVAAWLRGSGSIVLDGELVDGASAELARAQLWQWVAHGTRLADGRMVTAELVKDVIAEELERLRSEPPTPPPDPGRLAFGAKLLAHLTTHETLREPLTALAYEYLN